MPNRDSGKMISDEQRKRIEENRQKALEIRKKVAAKQSTSSSINAYKEKVHILPPSLQIPTGAKATDIRFVLITRYRFEAQTAYQAEVIEIFKTIPSRHYDAAKKRWNFDLQDYSNLTKALEPLRSSGIVAIIGFPRLVSKIFSTALSGSSPNLPFISISEFDWKKIDSCLVEALFPFQREGVCFAVSKDGRVLLADEMGLGKTIQALGIAAFYRQDWPFLIICPASLRYNWAEAIKRWLPTVSETDIVIINAVKDDMLKLSKRSVVITSYDLMVNLQTSLEEASFQFIILDESHFIKNYKTKRYRASQKLIKNAKRALLLTGTPALSRPVEIYSQVHCLRPAVFSNFNDFAQRYCNPKKNPWGWDYSGSSNMEELKIILEESVMIRRLKSQVLSQLPKKTRDMVVLDKQSVKTNLKGLQKAAAEMQRDDLKGMEKRGALLKFYSETALAKLDAVRSYITDLLETDVKFLVFAHHQVMMDDLTTLCCQKGVDFIRIDGSTPSEQRKRFCDDFQIKNNVKVALLSITAANTGLTLTAASLVIFAELFWNPGILVQAEDRVHRVGQAENVQIKYLCACGTADDHLWPLIQQKLGTLSKAGLSKDDFKEATTTVISDDDLPSGSVDKCPQKTILDYFSSLSEEDLNFCSSGENIDRTYDGEILSKEPPGRKRFRKQT